ncbi:YbaB/EbfC family nucleoid-associated protein [Mycobacterium sp. IS-1264]|uniref:YbaB/EbfC family nucleoid-associated protein n=1 Tax=Mycobacterium sp. IS-1264 TaxID=1834158 RepID=UPI0011156BF6|nr:YbaB/EbfC family nucleoid-associated protein [Mycobacterium sp. IS-1264]
MTSPGHPQVGHMMRHFEVVKSLLDEEVERMGAESFVVSDQAGTVEVTLNGHLRLTDLRIDPRILGLGAAEVTARINEALGAATDFACDCVETDLEELHGRVAEALAELRDLSPPM